MLKKKILKLLIGSNNQGKLKEIKDLLPKNILVYTPKKFNLKNPNEIGNLFWKILSLMISFVQIKPKWLLWQMIQGLK